MGGESEAREGTKELMGRHLLFCVHNNDKMLSCQYTIRAKRLFIEAIEALKTDVHFPPEIIFKTQADFAKALQPRYDRITRKLLSEVYKIFRDEWLSDELSLADCLFIRVEAYCLGFGFISRNPLPPSSWCEDLPLHRAIFANNLPLIRRLCVGEQEALLAVDLHQIDLNGNSPLMIAHILGRHDAI